jgi:hypothetical protein
LGGETNPPKVKGGLISLSKRAIMPAVTGHPLKMDNLAGDASDDTDGAPGLVDAKESLGNLPGGLAAASVAASSAATSKSQAQQQQRVSAALPSEAAADVSSCTSDSDEMPDLVDATDDKSPDSHQWQNPAAPAVNEKPAAATSTVPTAPLPSPASTPAAADVTERPRKRQHGQATEHAVQPPQPTPEATRQSAAEAGGAPTAKAVGGSAYAGDDDEDDEDDGIPPLVDAPQDPTVEHLTPSIDEYRDASAAAPAANGQKQQQQQTGNSVGGAKTSQSKQDSSKADAREPGQAPPSAASGSGKQGAAAAGTSAASLAAAAGATANKGSSAGGGGQQQAAQQSDEKKGLPARMQEKAQAQKALAEKRAAELAKKAEEVGGFDASSSRQAKLSGFKLVSLKAYTS